jgi:hypothetical protein
VGTASSVVATGRIDRFFISARAEGVFWLMLEKLINDEAHGDLVPLRC